MPILGTVATSTGLANGAATLTTSGGTIYVIWAPGTDSILVYKSTDTGASFSQVGSSVTSTTIHGSSNKINYIDAAIDGSDVIHVVSICGDSSVTRDVAYATLTTSNDSWGTWEQAAALTNTNIVGNYVQIAIDSNSKPHIAYVKYETSMGTEYRRIYYTNKTSGSWATPTMISTGTTTNYANPNIAIRNSNYIEISYASTVVLHRTYTTSWGSETSWTGSGLYTTGSRSISSKTDGTVYRYATTASAVLHENDTTTGYSISGGTSHFVWTSAYINSTRVIIGKSNSTYLQAISNSGSGWSSEDVSSTSIAYAYGDYSYNYRNTGNWFNFIVLTAAGDLKFGRYLIGTKTSSSQSAYIRGAMQASTTDFAFSTVSFSSEVQSDWTPTAGTNTSAINADDAAQNYVSSLLQSYDLYDVSSLDGKPSGKIKFRIVAWDDDTETLAPNLAIEFLYDTGMPQVLYTYTTDLTAPLITTSYISYPGGGETWTKDQVLAGNWGYRNTADNEALGIYIDLWKIDYYYGQQQTAYIEGASGGTPASTSKSAYLKGASTSSSARSAYLVAGGTSTAKQSAYIFGAASQLGNSPAYIRGQLATTANSPAYMRGALSTTANKAAYMAAGALSTSKQSAYLAGTAVSSGRTYAYLRGASTAQSQLYAFTRGQLATSGRTFAYLNVGTPATGVKSAYIAGKNSSTTSAQSFIRGMLTLGVNISSYIRGANQSLGNEPAFIRGSGTSSGSKSAFIEGTAIQVSTSKQAYLAGKSTLTSQQAAYSRGQLTALTSGTAFTRGSLGSSGNSPAYIRGLDAGISSKYAFLVGSLGATTSRSAYIQGSSSQTARTPAYMLGSSMAAGNVQAYLHGTANITASQSAFIYGKEWFPMYDNFTASDGSPWDIGKWVVS